MTDIPQAIVEKAAQAMWWARAVLAAVWPDVTAAHPVADEIALYHVIEAVTIADDAPTNPSTLAERITDAALTVVADAADVRRQTAEDIAAAIEEKLGETSMPDNAASRAWINAIHNAARLAREVGGDHD